MKTLIYGAIAAVLGLIGICIWFGQFVNIIAGVVPVVLILGGSLAIYIGIDEFKNEVKEEASSADFSSSPTEHDKKITEYEKEISELKKEISSLKKKDAPKE